MTVVNSQFQRLSGWVPSPQGFDTKLMVYEVLFSAVDDSEIDWLSNDEVTRADRFRMARDQRNYRITRGMLRFILETHLNENRSQIRFETQPKGKPYLPEHPHLKFNVSHTKKRAWIAVSSTREVGVDIEELRTVKNADGISGRFFCEREAKLIHDLDEPEKSRAFLQMWTLKEAWLKATGTGLSVPLNAIDTGFVAHNSLLNCDIPNWTLEVHPAADDLFAAICLSS